jgi:hypothetical protein
MTAGLNTVQYTMFKTCAVNSWEASAQTTLALAVLLPCTTWLGAGQQEWAGSRQPHISTRLQVLSRSGHPDTQMLDSATILHST